MSYLELPNVGTKAHWGRATREQLAEIERRSEENRQANRKAPIVPEKGRFTILGYLYTRRFTVILDDIGCVGEIDYDCAEGRYTVKAPCGYTLGVR